MKINNNKDELLKVQEKEVVIESKFKNKTKKIKQQLVIPKKVYFDVDLTKEEGEIIKKDLMNVLSGKLQEHKNLVTNEITYSLEYEIDIYDEESEEEDATIEDIITSEIILIDEYLSKIEEQKTEVIKTTAEFPTEINLGKEVLDLETKLEEIDIIEEIVEEGKINKKEKNDK